MEVAAAVGVIASVPVLYRAIRPHLNSTVTCWFCHASTKVKYENRNSFTCPSCDQYNGFNEDGDYNRKIPGQIFTEHKQFCEPVKTTEKEKSSGGGFLARFNGVNMSPKNANGLCSECNLGQEIIMNKIREFEPVDEDRWNEELEDYRYKLERMYQLCPRCTLHIHGKLEDDKKKYSYLLEMKYKLKHAIGSTLNEIIGPNQRKSRKFFFAGGKSCESLHLGCLFTSILLFLATIDFLQQDAGANLIAFPKILQDQFPGIFKFSFGLNLMVLIGHLIAAFNNKCRVTLPDLLFPIVLILSLLTYLAPDDTHSQDIALIRGGCASFSAILSMCVTFLPRKKLHKKKPNKFISSAFSVASTPTSQCSSQASRNASLLDHPDQTTTSFQHQRSPSNSPPTLRDITNASRLRNRENKENLMAESMDWDDSESIAQSTMTSAKSAAAFFKPGLLNRNRISSDLTPSVASLNLTPTPMDSPSIFSRQRRQMIQNQTPTRSLFGAPRSMVAPSNPVRGNYFATESNARSNIGGGGGGRESVFTSVSQQDGYSTMQNGAWQCRVLAILFALVFIVLVMQIALFYVLFTTRG